MECDIIFILNIKKYIYLTFFLFHKLNIDIIYHIGHVILEYHIHNICIFKSIISQWIENIYLNIYILYPIRYDILRYTYYILSCSANQM